MNPSATFKNEKCVGDKKSKQRVTILTYIITMDTKTRDLLMIGKFQEPCRSKNVKNL